MKFPRPHRLALLLLVGSLALACSRPEPPRVVILISIDTLRQDHLGCYGYGRPTSPVLDAFAAESAITFDEAYAQATYTLPSHMSMLTGLYPEAHGMLMPVFDDATAVPRLPESVTTLAEVLQGDGFATAAFTDGGLVDSTYGFNQGFDLYDDDRVESVADNGFERYRDELYAWLRDNKNRDHFVFVHTFDTHGPYIAPDRLVEEFRGTPQGRDVPHASLLVPSLLESQRYLELDQFDDLDAVIDEYDACIRFVDEEIGKLFDLLRELDRFDDALIIVTSDHGEQFLEDGIILGHGKTINNEVNRVPLLLKLPGSRNAGAREGHVVEIVDIPSTILETLGLEPPEAVDGQSLRRGVEEGIWAKDHAYGVNPFGGSHHYLLRDGKKLVQGLRRPRNKFVGQQLAPRAMGINPDGSMRVRRKVRYDYEKDPLGVLDAVPCEDRLYDMQSARFEWQAKTIADTKTLDALDTLAESLCRISTEKHMSHVEGIERPALDQREREYLEKLGYVEALNDTVETDADGDTPSEPERCDEPDPAPIDRSDLHRGDDLLWDLHRMRRGTIETLAATRLREMADESLAHYARFLEKHPERAELADWRRRYVEFVLEELAKK